MKTIGGFGAVMLLVSASVSVVAQDGDLLIARLGREGGDDAGMARVRATFVAAHPGYDLEWCAATREVAAAENARVLFVHRAAGERRAAVGTRSSPIAKGDLVILRRGEAAGFDGPAGVLCFTVPEDPPDSIPTFIRPDMDPKITDTPGGCATDGGAYRRLALTWNPERGAYVWHALNAHRVRMDDSFTHYHPTEGGWSELYLVQGAGEGARCVTAPAAALRNLDELDREEAASLLRTHALGDGDLVCFPPGQAHRGVGGVLAHVIAVPGFLPGRELGLDTDIAAAARRLGLDLPFHRPATLDVAKVAMQKLDDRVRITLDGQLFAEYRFAGPAAAPTLFPIHAASGDPVTRGFPLEPRPEDSRDHPHHVGMRLSHGDVNGLDFWHLLGKEGEPSIRHRRFVSDPEGPEKILRAISAWCDPEGQEVLRDERRIAFGLEDAARVIDFEVTLEALQDQVTFGDTKEGSFALRLAARLRGDRGAEIRSYTGLEGGAAWGKRAPWVVIRGKLDAGTTSVAIFDHPRNHAAPTWWHVRRYGLFAANPFGRRAFEGKSAPAGTVVLAKGERLHLQWRVLIFSGTPSDQELNARWASYARRR